MLHLPCGCRRRGGILRACRRKEKEKTFANSKWFTRVWTLQELIAPNYRSPLVEEKLTSDSEEWLSQKMMMIYSGDWSLLGNGHSLESRISKITGGPKEHVGWKEISAASISMRMSWAGRRQATRLDDIAYSLMSLFDVNMPKLYEEGELKAFIRLQEAIMQTSEDETLFAWQSAEPGTDALFEDMLARDPEDFGETKELVPFASGGSIRPYTLTQRGLRTWPQVYPLHRLHILARLAIYPLHSTVKWPEMNSSFAVLGYYPVCRLDRTVTIPSQHVTGSVYRRISCTDLFLVVTRFLPMPASIKQVCIKNSQDTAIAETRWRHFGFFFRYLLENLVTRQAYPASTCFSLCAEA